MKILFVCEGNHGRSQMAEAIFNKFCQGKHTSISSGTTVVTKEKNREGQKIYDPNIITIIKELGIDISENTRNQVTIEMLKDADKVVVMAEPETFPDFLKLNEKTIFWDVPDPFQQSLEFARDVRNRLQALVGDFIKTLD